jgi:hypothetical protein
VCNIDRFGLLLPVDSHVPVLTLPVRYDQGPVTKFRINPTRVLEPVLPDCAHEIQLILLDPLNNLIVRVEVIAGDVVRLPR